MGSRGLSTPFCQAEAGPAESGGPVPAGRTGCTGAPARMTDLVAPHGRTRAATSVSPKSGSSRARPAFTLVNGIG